MRNDQIPFTYPPDSPHEREALRRAGSRFIARPVAGEWVCRYSCNAGGVTVTQRGEDQARVSRWFNSLKCDWSQDFFRFSE